MNFCPFDGTKLEDAWTYCPHCGKAVVNSLESLKESGYSVWMDPVYIPFEQHCLFDGLKPGVYGIACPCPRCSPSFAATTTTEIRVNT